MTPPKEDQGILGWYETYKIPLVICLTVYVLSISFFIGYRQGASDTRGKFNEKLAEHRLSVLNEAVQTVNKLERNRGKYERLKFRASHLGIGLDI